MTFRVFLNRSAGICKNLHNLRINNCFCGAGLHLNNLMKPKKTTEFQKNRVKLGEVVRLIIKDK